MSEFNEFMVWKWADSNRFKQMPEITDVWLQKGPINVIGCKRVYSTADIVLRWQSINYIRCEYVP